MRTAILSAVPTPTYWKNSPVNSAWISESYYWNRRIETSGSTSFLKVNLIKGPNVFSTWDNASPTKGGDRYNPINKASTNDIIYPIWAQNGAKSFHRTLNFFLKNQCLTQFYSDIWAKLMSSSNSTNTEAIHIYAQASANQLASNTADLPRFLGFDWNDYGDS